jgi:hypothetical protein
MQVSGRASVPTLPQGRSVCTVVAVGAHRRRFQGQPRKGRACGVFRLTCAAESGVRPPTSALRSVPPAMSSPSCLPARPATVCDHQIRPGASCSAGLAESQPRRVRSRQPRPVAHVMPGTRVMFVAVAAFPAAVSPDHFPATERAVLLAGCCGGLAICHLCDPLRGGLRLSPLAGGIGQVAGRGMRGDARGAACAWQGQRGG